MKKAIFLIGNLMLLSASLFASYSTDWVRPADSYSKTGSMIARDKSDNVIVTGYIATNKIYTRKYDKFGNLMWEKSDSSGIQSNYEKPSWVNTDTSNNVFVVGYRYSFSSSWEYPNAVVVIKYNPAGTVLWRQVINLAYVVGSSSGFSFNMRSEVDAGGNLYIGTAGTSPSGFVLIKMNPAGTILFNNVVSLATGLHGFGSMRLKGNKVIVSGRSYVSTYNASVVAWDTAGTFLWSKTLTGVFGNDVEIDGSGNSYVLTSYANQVSTTSGYDVVVYKLNSAGTQVWKKNFDFTGQEMASRFTFVSNKLSIIATGYTSSYSDWITFQINTAGTKLWDARYNGTNGNDERPYFISAKANGDVFVTGIGGPTPVPNQLSWLRMVTLKYSSTGVRQWLDTLNINGGQGVACTIASDSSLYVVSYSYMTAYHFLDHTGTGVCGIPGNPAASNINNTGATITWPPVNGAYLYHLRYKTTSATVWTTISTNLTSINLTGLTQGTSYNYSVESVCSSGPSGYTASQTFTTTGTGYCATGGQSSAQEYLNLVWIGSIQNSTGNNNGYADFTNLSTTTSRGSTVSGYLRATLGGAFTEYYRVWVDYNHDGDFTDAGEQVASISSSSIGYNTVSFVVPATALLGVTRMRVTMQYGSAPAPCGTYAREETEDYNINIVTPLTTDVNIFPKNENQQLRLYPNPVSETIHFENIDRNNGKVLVEVYTISGQKVIELITTDNNIDVSQLPNGNYTIRVLQNKESFTSRFLIRR